MVVKLGNQDESSQNNLHFLQKPRNPCNYRRSPWKACKYPRGLNGLFLSAEFKNLVDWHKQAVLVDMVRTGCDNGGCGLGV